MNGIKERVRKGEKREKGRVNKWKRRVWRSRRDRNKRKNLIRKENICK
jgi:hypothetical protein